QESLPFLVGMGSKFPYGRCKQFQYSDVCPLLMDGGSGTVIRALAVFGYVGYRRVRIPGVDRSQVSLRRSTEPEQETAPGLPGLVDGDIESVEEWIIKVTMHEGLNIYDTEGTLLDLVREPILQWNLGAIMNKAQVKKLHPHVTDIKVAKCPCANDVALLGLILNETFNDAVVMPTGLKPIFPTQWLAPRQEDVLELPQKYAITE
ncbi:cation channel sperm-associated protein subunit beta, partial [Cricetulus griseus]